MSLTQETVALSQIEKQRRAKKAISLTNYENTSLPAIAAGGRVEIGDTLFYVGVEQAITGWTGIAVSTAAYIRIVPQGDGPPETALAEFTDVAPTWSDSKQGYYDATLAKRYIGGLYKDASGNYTKKWLYHSVNRSNLNIKFYADGSADFAGDVEITGNINAAAIPNNAINNVKIDKSFTPLGTYGTIAPGALFKPSAGIYTFTAGPDIRIQTYDGASWWEWASDFGGGTIITDGSSVQLHNSAGSNRFYHYIKLD